MIDKDTLNAIEEMLDRKLDEKLEEKLGERLDNLSSQFDSKLDNLEEKFDSKLSPIYREILTLHGMVHGLENDVSDIRSDTAAIRVDVATLKAQADYNYDKILNNYGAIKELQTMMEDKADKPSITLYKES